MVGIQEVKQAAACFWFSLSLQNIELSRIRDSKAEVFLSLYSSMFIFILFFFFFNSDPTNI